MLTKKGLLAWVLTVCALFNATQGEAWIKEEGRDLYHPVPTPLYDLETGLPAFDVTLGYSTGRRVGINHAYSFAGITWYPDLHFGNYHTFVEATGYRLSTGKWAASGGIGVRRWNPSLFSVIGINLFYDFRTGQFGNYNQIGLGLEWLTPWADVRVNGYLPVGPNCRCRLQSLTFYPKGGFWAMSNKSACAFSGVDAEVGGSFWNCGAWSVYGALGTYYWRRPNISHQAYGVQARLDFRYRNWVQFEVFNSYDNLFHYRVQGTISITIPFESLFCIPSICCFAAAPWWNPPVQRQPMIVLDKTCCWKTNYNDKGLTPHRDTSRHHRDKDISRRRCEDNVSRHHRGHDFSDNSDFSTGCNGCN